MFDGDLAVKIEKTSLVPSLFSSERQWICDSIAQIITKNLLKRGREGGIGVKGKRAFFDARSLMLSRVSSPPLLSFSLALCSERRAEDVTSVEKKKEKKRKKT